MNMELNTLRNRLLQHWMAWGAPSDPALCMNETSMAFACKQAAHVIDELTSTLWDLYLEQKDYIEINNLGDPHHNKSMQNARSILEKLSTT